MKKWLALLPAVVVIFFVGWLVDDKLFGDDISHRVSVAGVSIGGLSQDDARTRLEAAALTDRPIELHWAGTSITRSAAELGLTANLDTALSQARHRGSSLTRPFDWARSLFITTSIDITYAIDQDRLASFFGVGNDAIFGLDFGQPVIELVNGEFVEINPADVPVVDIDELERLVLEAAMPRTNETAIIEVPVSGSRPVARGAEAIIEQATELTAGGLDVNLAGATTTHHIDEPTVRSWIVFEGTRDNPLISINHASSLANIESLSWGLGGNAEEAEFSVNNFGQIQITSGVAGSVCCGPDTPDRIMAALLANEDSVDLVPVEDPDARGVAWAESLGIKEVIGEFTTNFKPGQSRVTNIDRISELTRGALIEPGETFSVNDYVGVRTRAKGFVAAGVIANGTFQNSVGGGISQYATTLFNAAFFAGLEFGEYQSHSIYIKRYPYGREATVSHPFPDLQIVNNTPYGILLWPTTTKDSITVRLFSTKWVEGAQTGQSRWTEGVSCTRVKTERTRTWVDGRVEIDTVTARYRPEGIACNGSSTRPATTTTTVAPTAAAPTTTTTTTAAPAPPPTTTAPTTTTVAPTTTTTVAPTTTTAPPPTTADAD